MAKTSAHAIKPTQVIKPVFSGNMVQPTYHPQRTHTPAFNKSYKGKHLDNARKIDETIRQANCDDSLPGKSTTIFHQADLAAHDHRPMPEVGLDSHSAAPSVNGTPVEGVLTGNKHVRFRIDRPFEQPVGTNYCVRLIMVYFGNISKIFFWIRKSDDANFLSSYSLEYLMHFYDP